MTIANFGGRKFHLDDLVKGVQAVAQLTAYGEEGETSELREAVMERCQLDYRAGQKVVGLSVEGGLLSWATNAKYRTRYVRSGDPFDVVALLEEKGVIEVTTPRKKGFGRNLSALDGGITAGAALPVGQVKAYEKAIKEAAKKPAPKTEPQVTHYDAEAEAEAREAEKKVVTEAASQELVEAITQASAPVATQDRPSRDSMILRLGTDLRAARDRIAALEEAAVETEGLSKAFHEAKEQLSDALDKLGQQRLTIGHHEETIAQLNDTIRHKDAEINDLKEQLKQAWAIAAQAKPEFDNEEAALLSHLYPGEF